MNNKIITASAVLLLCLLTGCKDAAKTVGAEQTVSDTSVTAETSETVKDCCHEDAACCEESAEEKSTEEKDCCHNEETCCEESGEKDCCDDKSDGDETPVGIADCCG